MRRAFTLLELLVTVTIIAILSSLAWGGYYQAMENVREDATARTILKIDKVIQELWNSYPTRRLPITRDDAGPSVYGPPPPGSIPGTKGPFLSSVFRNFAANCRRDLIRIEMPDRWSDVLNPPLFLPVVDDHGNALRSGRQEAWRRMLAQAVDRAGQSKVDAYESCEALYLVVASGDRELVRFTNREKGDVDGDGLKEFHDAWGRPICWHRWPAGWATREGAEWSQPEPMSSNTNFDTLGPYPLIFSAGRDGIFDVNRGVEEDASGDWVTYEYGIDVYGNLNPWTKDENNPPHHIAEPLDSHDLAGNPPNGSLDHFDNITNYALQ